ncbi:MAG TPA: PAS domain S-box protein, partial [Flavisolibacter sp.]|nr:PAS domain S-box protein [Flavisolibacter sp.]
MKSIAASLTQQFPDLVMVLSAEGIIQDINPAFTSHLGFTAAEVKGRPYGALLVAHPSNAEVSFPGGATTPVAGVVHQLQGKEGTAVTVRWSGCYVQQEAVCFYTGRIQEEAQPTKREYLFEALVENTFDLLAVTNEDGIWTYVSDSLAQQMGATRSELIGQNCFDYMHPNDRPQLAGLQEALLQGQKKVQVAPYRFRNAAGEWMWMEAIVTNQLGNPDIKGIIITCRNISDRIAAERRAKEVQLLEALREGEEKERSRIARDLHDEISGMIAAAKMHVATLAKTIPAIAGSQEYGQALCLLDETARQVRNTSHNLMPEILLERGLSQALSRYCSSISHAALKLRYIEVGPVS